MTTLYEALVRYAASAPGITPPYYAPVTFEWELALDERGVPLSDELRPLTHTVTSKTGKTTTQPGRSVPAPYITRTRAIVPMLGSDQTGYVLGWSDENLSPDNARARHQAFFALTKAWAASELAADDPVPPALLAWLRSWRDQISRPESATAKQGVLITVAGQNAFDSRSAAEFWARHASEKKGSGRQGVCLVCGRTGALVETLSQMVKGHFAPGGQSSGVAPISINEGVFGFGLRKGLDHVPICETCGNAIPAALNDLLGDPTRTHRDDVAATTWWLEGGSTFDPWEITQDPQPAEVRRLIDSVTQGKHSASEARADQFCSLTVSGNASRLVVRRWRHMPLARLMANVAAWFGDSEIEPASVDRPRHLPLWRLANATGRWDPAKDRYLQTGDKAGHHPHGITQTLEEAALDGADIPPSVIAHLVQRIAGDRRVDDPRAALLRLALTRSPLMKETIMPGLDETLGAPCYVAGRLFALYEDLQVAAATVDGGERPNATFADKNLAGAISSPQLVLAAGGKQSAAWLAKLRKKGWDGRYRRRLDAVMGLLDPADPVPVRADVGGQALFVLGYHHQSNALRIERDEARAQKELARVGESTETTDEENR